MSGSKTKSLPISVRFLKLGALRHALSNSLFFVPFVMVALSLLLSQITVGVDRQIAEDVLPQWFESTVDSSRAILSAIAGGTITAASIVFSLTLVAVQLAASQFSPRVLRGFLSDRFQQLVMGTVVGTFSYSLLVLREVRSSGEDAEAAFIPQISIAVALVLAVAALVAVLASIDHTAKGLRVGSVADDIVESTMKTIEQLFEDRENDQESSLVIDAPGLSPAAHSARSGTLGFEPPDEAQMIEAYKTGWVTGLQTDALIGELPDDHSLLVTAAVGTFVVRGTPMAYVWPSLGGSHDYIEKIEASVRIEEARTMQQDVAFGFLQLNDIALRALSPGVNDPNTANEIAVRLGALVTELYRRDLPPAETSEDGRRLLRPTEPTYDDYVQLAFEPIRRYARTDPAVLEVIARTIASIIDDIERRHGPGESDALYHQLHLMRDETSCLETEEDRRRVRAILSDLLD